MKSAPEPHSTATTEPEPRHDCDVAGGRSSIVVEFAGRAGVGKSTIARRLEASLAAESVRTCSATRDRIPVIARVRPVDFLHVLRIGWTLRLRIFSWTTVKRTIGVYKELVRLRACLTTPGVYVLDQGLIQYLQQLKALRPPSCERLGAYHRALVALPVPTHLVIVTCPPEPLVARKRPLSMPAPR